MFFASTVDINYILPISSSIFYDYYSIRREVRNGIFYITAFAVVKNYQNTSVARVENHCITIYNLHVHCVDFNKESTDFTTNFLVRDNSRGFRYHFYLCRLKMYPKQ